MAFRERAVRCANQQGSHLLTYYEWGDPDNDRVLLCVHGLARTGRDFDHLARVMEDRYRVICPDMVGRGHSEWLPVKADYNYPQYVRDMLTLIAHLRPARLDWLGTSMGGMTGMILAAQDDNPIHKLVLNDVGAVLAGETVKYLQAWFGEEQHFADLDEAESYCRSIYKPFGDLSDAEWREIAENTVRPAPEGGYTLHYDPAIADNVRTLEAKDYAVWEIWDAIRAPVLLIHGRESIVLTDSTVEEMMHRGPVTDLIEFPGIGHAPTLTREEQIAPVREWLLRD